MVSEPKLRSSINDANKASVDFLKIDVETGLTFAGIARSTSDPKKRERTTRVARRAYDTVCQLFGHVHPEHSDARFIEEHLQHLKAELIQLGERL